MWLALPWVLKKNVVHLEARNEVVHAYANHEKAHQIFSIDRTTTLEEGVEIMAKWALQVGARKSKDFHNIEINEKLPPSWASQMEAETQK